MRKIVALAIVASLFVSCKGEKKALLPSVSGKAGEIMVVIEKPSWEGDLGNALRDLLACDCPYFVQREPLYSLANVIPSGFGNIFQVHRNIILCNVDPQGASEGVKLLKDVWAQPQSIIRIDAPTDERAIELLSENASLVLNAFEQAERDRVIANTLLYENRDIYAKLSGNFGGAPHFPSGYTLKKMTSDFAWVADEKQYTNQAVLMYSYPAKGDSSDLSVESIISHRNEILKEEVPGMFDGTYMTTAMAFSPLIEYLTYKGRSFAQVRGYWEVYNDFMGGPFVSHSFYSEDGSQVIVLEAFVYAPRYDKRQYLRQVESLLYSFEYNKN